MKTLTYKVEIYGLPLRLWNYTKNFELWFTVKTLKHNSTLLWIYKNKVSYKKPWNYTENKGAYIY